MSTIIFENTQPEKHVEATLVGDGKVIVIDEAWTSLSEQNSIALLSLNRPGKSVAINPFTEESLAEKIHDEHDKSST